MVSLRGNGPSLNKEAERLTIRVHPRHERSDQILLGVPFFFIKKVCGPTNSGENRPTGLDPILYARNLFSNKVTRRELKPGDKTH